MNELQALKRLEGIKAVLNSNVQFTEIVECPLCHGKGELPHEVNQSGTFTRTVVPFKQFIIECHECHGLGEIRQNATEKGYD